MTSIEYAWVTLLAAIGVIVFYYFWPFDTSWFLWPVVLSAITSIAFLVVHSFWPLVMKFLAAAKKWLMRKWKYVEAARAEKIRLRKRISAIDDTEEEFVSFFFSDNLPPGGVGADLEMSPELYDAGCRLATDGVLLRTDGSKVLEFELTKRGMDALTTKGFSGKPSHTKLQLDPKLVLVRTKSGGGTRSSR